MKLRSQIIRGFFISIILPMLLLSVISLYFFQNSFDKYLKYEQQLRLEKIESLTKKLFSSASSTQDFNELFWYVTEENISLDFYDNQGKLMNSFNTIPGRNGMMHNKNYVSKKMDVVKDGKKIGSVVFGYLNNNDLDPRASDFVNSLINLFILSVGIAMIAAMFVSSYFSKSISMPILSLSKATRSIKGGKFEDLEFPKSNVFEVQTLSNDIDYLAQSLKVQENIRKNYAQDISHELRTPLTNLQLHLEAMQDGIIDKSDENFHIMLMELNRLNSLVKDLKNSFNDTAADMGINNSIFNLTDMLNNIVDTMKPGFDGSGISLTSHIECNMEVKMDEEKLRQVIYNFLTNAKKACKENCKVDVRLTRKNGKLFISVKDNGIGISEANQKLIYNRFFRVDDARNTKENGYGLGLSIVKNMVDAMGGKILLHSKEGSGSEFIVEFNENDIDAIELVECV